MFSLNVVGSTSMKIFFESRLKNRHLKVKEAKLPGLSEKDCLDQQSFLNEVLGQDQDNTLFAMDHGDIKPGNIVVDKEHNIAWYRTFYYHSFYL